MRSLSATVLLSQPERFYYTDAISDNAVRFLGDHQREADGQPFFMYVAYTAPHWPMHALPEDVAKYEGKYDGKYDGGYGPTREARIRKLRSLGLLPAKWELVPQVGDWEDHPGRQRQAPRDRRLQPAHRQPPDRRPRGRPRRTDSWATTGRTTSSKARWRRSRSK